MVVVGVGTHLLHAWWQCALLLLLMVMVVRVEGCVGAVAAYFPHVP
jgi:hypothetical protein